MNTPKPLLQLNQFRMAYSLGTKQNQRYVHAIDTINLSIYPGETVGLVGESGSGKSSIGFSIMRLLPENAKILGGSMMFDGMDLTRLSENDMRRMRWSQLAMVFQAAMNALNPVYTVADQIIEAIRYHEPKLRGGAAFERVAELFEIVGINPERMHDYPHEYSGGMRQRAMIAMALSCSPKFVIADEPTTALDVIVQGQILDKIKEIQQKLKLTMLYITHDISVVMETCQKVGVMYAGQIVEFADVTTIHDRPAHPYTRELIRAYPSLFGEVTHIEPIPGEPPDLSNPPSGCKFHPRCPLYINKGRPARCTDERPEYRQVEPGHWASCHFAEALLTIQPSLPQSVPEEVGHGL